MKTEVNPDVRNIETKSQAQKGVKHDGGKARIDLIPPEVIEAIAQSLTRGSEKYGERNWELGIRWGRCFAALMRHMWAWWRGVDIDAESGQPHLWHALANLAFLITYAERKIGQDDRSKTNVN